MRLVAVCLAWLAVTSSHCCADASSPKANKVDHASQGQTDAPAYQGGTEVSPFFVKVIPSSDVKTEAAEEQREEDRDGWDRAMDCATICLAGITLVLAFFTGGLWFHTYKLVKGAEEASKKQIADMRESLDIARKSAEIAKESADSTAAMVKTMQDTAKKELRAYIGITAQAVKDDGIRIGFANGGATPAHKVIACADIVLSVERGLEMNEIKKRMAGRQSQVTDSGLVLWKGSSEHILVRQSISEIAAKGSTFIHGNISYEDAFGDRHDIWFQYQLIWDGGWKFVPCLGCHEST